MKKILWLSSIEFSSDSIRSTGSWVQPLAEAIVKTREVQVAVITMGQGSRIIENDCNGIHQWILPRRKTTSCQIASHKTCMEVAKIIDNWQPDLVHIWGTESIWASIYHAGYIKTKTLIDIQGLLLEYSDYFYGQLTWLEIARSIHLKEVIMPWRTLPGKKREFYKRGLLERKYLKTFVYISTQSQWVRDHLAADFPQVHLFNTKIMLRASFYNAEAWCCKDDSKPPVVFTMCSGAVSYKGIHVAIKAIDVLRRKYPNVQLHIAGNMKIGNKLLDGYSIFLQKLIAHYHLQENIKFLGSLSDVEIIKHLQSCNVCIVPSFIESYCLAFAEAMIVGVPTVVSYTGAMPEQAVDGKEALFYNSLDHVSAAACLDRLISDHDLAKRISVACRLRKLRDNNPESVVQTQMKIYEDVLGL